MTNREVKRNSLIIGALLGGVAGVIIMAALLYGCAVLIQKETVLTYALAEEAGIACVFLGATLAGVISAKRRGRGVLPSGLAAGGVAFGIVTVIAVVFVNAPIFGVMTIKHLVCCLAGSAFGTVLCVGKKHKNTRYR